MKANKIVILLCLTGMAGMLSAQSVRIDEKGKAGYIGSNGSELVPCEYDAAYPFEGGMGKVMKGKKFGLVNQSGKLVVPTKYEEITYEPYVDLFRVAVSGKYGLLDAQGNEILKPQFSYISPYNSHGKALLAIGGKNTPGKKGAYMNGAKYGIVDASGTVVIAPTHKGIYEFSEEWSKYPVKEGRMLEYSQHCIGDTLKTACKYLGYNENPNSESYAGILDEHGNILMPMKTEQWICEPRCGMVRYFNPQNSIGYYNLEKKQSLPISNWEGTFKNTNYWTHGDFLGEIAPIIIKNQWCFVNKEGKTVKSGYSYIKSGSLSNLWAAQKENNDLWEAFDLNGNPAFEGSGYTDFSFAQPYDGADGNYVAVKKGDKWGVVNLQNKEVLPFAYEEIGQNVFGFIPVKDKGKWGCITTDKVMVVPFAYTGLKYPNSKDTKTISVKKEDDLWYIYSLNRKTTFGSGYSDIGPFTDGVAWAKPQDLEVTDNHLNRTLAGITISDSFSEKKSSFALFVGEDGQVLINDPIPTDYISTIRKELKMRELRPLSQAEAKGLKLRLTAKQRHYMMGLKIDENEWDY